MHMCVQLGSFKEQKLARMLKFFLLWLKELLFQRA